MPDIDFDAALAQVGEKGRFQNRIFYLLAIPATLPAIFLYFSQVFVSATPEHWCRVPELDEALGVEQARAIAVPYTVRSDGSHEYSRCEVFAVNFTQLLLEGGGVLASDNAWNRTACHNGWHYNRTYYDETLVSQLDLVCDKSWWPATSTTCFCIGSLAGDVLFGLVGDRLGRRPALLITIAWHVLMSISTAVFTTNYVTYTVLRTVNAVVFPAIYQVPFVLSLEIMGTKHRTFAGMMLCVFFALALVLLALITFVLRDWYSLLLYTSLPCIALFGYFWIVPESPRWLVSKGRVDEAEVIMQKIAKENGKVIPKNFLRQFEIKEEEKLDDIVRGKKERDYNVTFFDLLRRPVLRRGFVLIAIVWITNAMVYGGLTFNSGNLGVRDQTAFLIGAAVEVPSYFFSWWAMDRFGRRLVTWVCMLVGGLSCVSCALVPDGDVWITVTLAMIGRFGISASFAVFYVYVGELLPTVVRSQSMASGSFIANIGWILFPYIVHLSNFWRVLPLLIFGSLSIAGALATMLLPETLGCNLPQTLSDGETLHLIGSKSSSHDGYVKPGEAAINN